MTKKILYSENKEFYKQIGSELKELRSSKGLRLEDVAKKMNKGISSIHDYETGKSQMTLGIFMDYCDAISEDYIQVWNEFHYKQKYRKNKE